MTIEMIKNPDIIAHVAQLKDGPFVIGFAAETQKIEEYALSKMQRKGLDMIIANDVADATIGFNSDHNAVLVFDHTQKYAFASRTKSQLSRDLIGLIAAVRNNIDTLTPEAS